LACPLVFSSNWSGFLRFLVFGLDRGINGGDLFDERGALVLEFLQSVFHGGSFQRCA
jgi:hypothetical protein